MMGITPPSNTIVNPAERRVLALDGLRGAMTILVVLSHFFGEIPHGIHAFETGWIAVNMFFVLSGYLVGNLILEKMHYSRFFATFYTRRFCRTLPIYFVCVALIGVLLHILPQAGWVNADHSLPLWSYFVFVQNFFMVSQDTTGAAWLGPTWTLAVEEHFYLIAPTMFLITPRRYLPATLIFIGLLAVILRAIVFYLYLSSSMLALVILPFRGDILVSGLLLAVWCRSSNVKWERWDFTFRLAPLALLILAVILKLIDGSTGQLFTIFGSLVISVACAFFILILVRGAPEAARFRSKILRFFGQTSYAVYLTHMLVLGLMHGLILGAVPDIETGTQILVTLAALPVTVLVGWALTKLVEEPITNYGRSYKWGVEKA